ncbi:MAG: hypothetical protein WC645_01075 [Candidatus Margulisiibacteriota bacterium]
MSIKVNANSSPRINLLNLFRLRQAQIAKPEGRIGIHPPIVDRSAIPTGIPLSVLAENIRPANFILNTTDAELIGDESRTWMDRGPYVPESLKAFPEKDKMWELVKSPTADLARITQRQMVLETLSASEYLREATEAKNGAYLVHHGISALFQPVDLGGYGHQEPALSAYLRGEKGLEGQIYEALAQIEEGKKALAGFIDCLKKVNPQLFRSISADLKQHLRDIEHFNEDYFLRQRYEQYKSMDLSGALFCDLVKIGAFVSFANLVVEGAYSRANFDPAKPKEYKAGWLFVRPKNGQVLNDSPADKTLTILSGSNMSGKSFNLKQNLLMQLLAQSFGYVPCREGNFEVHDSIAYLDRASTSPHNDLSAFGQEIKEWNTAIADFGTKPLLFIDEGFSTTSPEDQFRLLTAVNRYIEKHGARMFLASHNERFIERLGDEPTVGIYHFKTEIGPRGDISYQYTLEAGPDDSKALAVAENLGFLASTVALARNYLAGILGKIERVIYPEKKTIKPYSEAERARLKTKDLTAASLASKKNGIFHLYSQDPNFQAGLFRGSDIFTGEEPHDFDQRISLGGWRIDCLAELKSNLLRLITGVGKLSPQETLERQKMFAELAGNDRYDEAKALFERIIYQAKFLPVLPGLIRDGLLNFNVRLHPFENMNETEMLLRLDLVIAYLEMNKILLEKDFTLDPMLEQVKVFQRLLDDVEKIQAEQEIGEIEEIIDREEDEEAPPEIAGYFRQVTGEEGVVTRRRVRSYLAWLEGNGHKRWNELYETFMQRTPGDKFKRQVVEITPEVADRFRMMSPDEPNREDWGNEVTKERVEAYIDWVFKDCDRKDKAAKKMLRPFLTGYSFREFSAAAIREKFFSLAVGEPNPEKWGSKVNRARIIAYLNYLKAQPEGTAVYSQILELSGLENSIKWHQRCIGLKDAGIRDQFAAVRPEYRNTRITADIINEAASELMRRLKDPERLLVGKPIFLCDLSRVKAQLDKLIAAIKQRHKGGDYEYYHQWPKDLSLALVIEMLIDDHNIFGRLIEIMRNYDSVHLTRLANNFDLLRKRILDSGSFQEVEHLFKMLKKPFNVHLKEYYLEYLEVEKEYRDLWVKYPRLDSHSHPNYAEHLYNCCLLGRCPSSPEEFFRYFSWYTGTGWEETAPIAYAVEDAGPGEKRERIFQEFLRKHLVESGLLDELRDVVNTNDRLQAKMGVLSRKYGIPHEKVGEFFASKIGNALNMYDRGGDRVIDEALGLQSLFLYGHMVQTMGFSPVDFNDTGEVRFDGLWNLVKPKDAQVSNPASFNPDEQVKLVTGANMSGKTFYLKSLIFGVLSGLATGFAPARTATMPLFDSVAFLDRVTAKNDRNLSAFGNELTFWSDLLKLLDRDERVFSCVDEAFSTTSPRYQSALTFAIASEMLTRGQYLALASHNHDALSALEASYPHLVRAYHFHTHFDGAEIQFDYRATPGHELSQAIAVARKLGLPPEIIDLVEEK